MASAESNSSHSQFLAQITAHPSLGEMDRRIITVTFPHVVSFMSSSHFDASHDMEHVKRVTLTALAILEDEQKRQRGGTAKANSEANGVLAETVAAPRQQFDVATVILGALLHDVDDKKYAPPAAPGTAVPSQASAMLSAALSTLSPTRTPAQSALLTTLAELVGHVSYSTEIANPAAAASTLRQIPELAIVQDADRLDALGAVGIARCFAYGAARTTRPLQDGVVHFDEKLVKLERMMKTARGREMAKERTRRITEFTSWWADETGLGRGADS